MVGSAIFFFYQIPTEGYTIKTAFDIMPTIINSTWSVLLSQTNYSRLSQFTFAVSSSGLKSRTRSRPSLQSKKS